MFARPISEIETLYKKKHSAKSQELTEGMPVQLDVSAELLDVRATFDVGDAKTLGLDIGGNRVLYDVIEEKLISPAVEDSTR